MASLLAGITLLFTLAWIATLALRNASAGVRHVIWTCAIAGALLLGPLRWRVPQSVVSPVLPFAATPVLQVEAQTTGAPIPLAIVAVWIWAFGAALVMIRLAISGARLGRIVRNAARSGHAGPVPILASQRVPGPLIAGLFQPVILLPEHASRWNASRRRAVLAHELAHIRRRDPLVLFIAHLATALYWFHPLCWLAAARLRAESERACDDAALRLGLLPSGYATHLLGIARAFNPQPAIPMATTSHLELRVKSILDPFVNRHFAARGTWLAGLLVTAAIMAPLSTLTLHAQQAGFAGAGGAIDGAVVDASGARVPRAEIIASTPDGGNRQTVLSGEDGAFTLRNLPAGRYMLEVRARGFAVFQLQNLEVTDGATLRADARLRLGGISEKIQVVAKGAPNPAASADAGPKPIRVGGNVQAANLIQQVRPVYPPDLQAQGAEGTVFLQAVISKEGIPLSLSVHNADVNPEFANAAMDAVKQWRYRPTLLNGQPIDVITTITVEFRLQQ
ncbi:MAG TPA: M56 family metallopeptidase [Bryobacteraceae bacterium]|nr:M56 family metallopeptidase [Bryobacteraceae bacterium]